MAAKKLKVNEKEKLYALASALAGRALLASRLGKSYGGKRDLYEALGYTKTPTIDDYIARYSRQDIAKAIIDAPAEECWRDLPEIGEPTEEDTDFENAWDKLVKDKKLANVLPRLDRLASLGQYAVLLLGFNDQSEGLSTEATKATELLYATPYSERSAIISTYDLDVKSPRYGFPLTYTIRVQGSPNMSTPYIVHHSRVVHLAEDCLENNVFGTPRLESVLNRLQDLELISGGSAEMFWRGAFPGMAMIQDTLTAEMNNTQKAAYEEEIEDYLHGLKRYMKLKNITVDQLAVQVADPTNHISIQIDLISAATRIPKRILLGSERGELASSQDERAWATRIDTRRKSYCGPMIIQPLIERLVSVGILPNPKVEYSIKWPDPLAPSEKDKAETGEIRARSLASYTNALGADQIVSQEMFAEKMLGFSPEDIKRNYDILKTYLMDEPAAPPDPGAQI